MKKKLLRSSLREIRQAPGRFLSILGIIFLGVAFFVGISATGPNMEQAAEDYFARQKLADFTIASTLGLSTADREIIEEMPGVTSVEAEQIADINAENHRAVIAWERVIRRVVQEVIAYIGDKRPFMREQLAHCPGESQADGNGQRYLDHQMTLRVNLPTFSP